MYIIIHCHQQITDTQILVDVYFEFSQIKGERQTDDNGKYNNINLHNLNTCCLFYYIRSIVIEYTSVYSSIQV